MLQKPVLILLCFYLIQHRLVFGAQVLLHRKQVTSIGKRIPRGTIGIPSHLFQPIEAPTEKPQANRRPIGDDNDATTNRIRHKYSLAQDDNAQANSDVIMRMGTVPIRFTNTNTNQLDDEFPATHEWSQQPGNRFRDVGPSAQMDGFPPENRNRYMPQGFGRQPPFMQSRNSPMGFGGIDNGNIYRESSSSYSHVSGVGTSVNSFDYDSRRGFPIINKSF